jgi:hypothetical protein
VSIMPGIETRAPERTETSSGSAGSPNFLPTACFDMVSAIGHFLRAGLVEKSAALAR